VVYDGPCTSYRALVFTVTNFPSSNQATSTGYGDGL
jgi:hypothetical protein